MGILSTLNLWRKKRSSIILGQRGMVLDNRVLARGHKTLVHQFMREDVDKWMAWPMHQDPLYASSYPRTMNRFERDDWFQDRSSRNDYMMFAAEDFQGNLIGLITLRNIERNRTHAVLGITIRPEILGSGFGTDCLWIFLYYYFETLHFDALILDVAAYNYRAQRVYEKCGFVRTGEHWGHYDDYSVFYNDYYKNIRNYFRQRGAWIETLYYDMILRRYDYLHLRKQGYDPTQIRTQK